MAYPQQAYPQPYPQMAYPQPYRGGPWPGPQPKKKSGWLPVVITLAVLFFVVGPLVTFVLIALASADPEARNRPTNGPTQHTNPTNHSDYNGTPDLNPDDPPMPQTMNEVYQILESSPLYSQTLSPTQCTIADIDLVNASVPVIEDHLNAFVNCLMSAWIDPVNSAGFSLPHPSVTVYTTEVTTPCGKLPMHNAVYCSADQQIYYAKDLVEVFDGGDLRLVAEAVMAHEFGHEIQYRTMILISGAVLQNEADTEAEAFGWSRRIELQADCLAGVYLNSISQSAGITGDDRQRIINMFTTLGSSRPFEDDHGSGANRAYWTGVGLGSMSPGSCSTFTAPADDVG